MFLRRNLKTRPKTLMELKLSNTTINLDFGFKTGLGPAASGMGLGQPGSSGEGFIMRKQII